MPTESHVPLEIDAETSRKIVESLISHGDLSQLGPAERATLYVQMCQSLGLSPATLPFTILKSRGGKDVLYPNRSATDQLAAIHRLDREIVQGPDVITIGTTKIAMVVCKVTHPNGRVETAVGTVSLEDPVSAFMKAECVPLDSEILTRRGFKPYDQIKIGEEVIAYNPDRCRCEWVPLENVTVYDDARIFRMSTEGGRFSVRCTEDHSWLVGTPESRDSRNHKRFLRTKLVKANEILAGHRVILAAPAEGGDHPLSPELAAVLGWVMTDGTIKRLGNFVSLGISQSKPNRVKEIRDLLLRAGLNARENIGEPTVCTFPSGRSYDCLPQHWFYLNAEESRGVLSRAGIEGPADMPRLVTRLSVEARNAMLETMMAGDGDEKGVFGKKRKPGVMEAQSILATLSGIALGKPGMSSVGEVPLHRMLSYNCIAGRNLSLTEDGTGPVWCPTTRFGTWIMRQNRRIMITGNTKAKRRATLSILGLGMLDESGDGGESTGSGQAQSKGSKAAPKSTKPAEFEAFEIALKAARLPDDCVQIWMDHREALAALDKDTKSNTWKMLCKKTQECGITPNASEWLKQSIRVRELRKKIEEEERAKAAPVSKPTEAPSGPAPGPPAVKPPSPTPWLETIRAASPQALQEMVGGLATLLDDDITRAYAARWATLVKTMDEHAIKTTLDFIGTIPHSLQANESLWEPLRLAIEQRERDFANQSAPGGGV